MQLLGFGLVCLVLLGAAIANRAPLPNAVVWAIMGFAIPFIPGAPDFRPDPRLALYAVLPPLVYASAVRLPWPEFRANLRPISMLALGLVAATTCSVAWVAHAVFELSWPAAFALGAVISPTDPVAASAVASRVGLPRRLVAILEGEGLVNDAVALTIFRIALAAWAGQAFSAGWGLLRFLAILVGEPLYGWLLGKLVAWIRSRIADPQIEIGVSLLTPFAAYLVPESLGGSGILATVAVGMYIGEQSWTLVPAGTRLHATSFWNMIVFLLNGGLFMVAGFELGRVAGPLHVAGPALAWGLLAAVVVVGARILWCFLSWLLLRLTARNSPGSSAGFRLDEVAVVSWSGMRGPISLAAALSIPVALDGSGRDFNSVVSITATVIVCTLIGQGAILPFLVRALGLSKVAAADSELVQRQQALGEKEAAAAALRRLAELEGEGSVDSADAARLRRIYEERAAEAPLESSPADTRGRLDTVRSELMSAERRRILALRREGRLSDDALAHLQRALDLREALVN